VVEAVVEHGDRARWSSTVVEEVASRPGSRPTDRDYPAGMGFLDDAKKFIGEHDEQVDRAIEKAGDLVDEKTDRRFADKVDQAQDLAEQRTGDGDTVS
jgi:hypothetical protein